METANAGVVFSYNYIKMLQVYSIELDMNATASAPGWRMNSILHTKYNVYRILIILFCSL